jgi:hypothetical protein
MCSRNWVRSVASEYHNYKILWQQYINSHKFISRQLYSKYYITTESTVYEVQQEMCHLQFFKT